VTTNGKGLFEAWGLAAGTYLLSVEAEGYKSLSTENVFLEPEQTLYLKIVLRPQAGQERSKFEQISLDYTSCLEQTTLSKDQIFNYPSGHNVWSLIENQDLSATTNRIDVGGLWGSRPALFSARGSCSWTQNTYLLNGLDVTDPYWTGFPLFYPDYYGLDYTQLINAGHPPYAFSPGGYFNLLTQEETTSYRGGASIFFLNKMLQSRNISSSLIKEGLTDSHGFNYYVDGNFHLSGPIIKNKLHFFTSLSTYHFSRDLADYAPDDKASIYTGLISLKYNFHKSSLRLLWSGQIVRQPSFGAGRGIPLSSTLERNDHYHIFQCILNSRLRNNHSLMLSLGLNKGIIDSNFKKGIFRPYSLEILRNIPSGLAPMAGHDKRMAVNILAMGDIFLTKGKRSYHRLQYGFQFKYGQSLAAQEIYNNLHIHFFEGKPLEIVKYNTPLQHKELAYQLDFFCEESLTFSNLATLILGFHLIYSKGWAQPYSSSFENSGRIKWANLSPRAGFILPLTKSKKTALKFWAARYYFTLPLSYLSFGNPDALGGLVYRWDDKNKDKEFQPSEEQELVERQGPLFSRIDPDLKRPYTDELVISLQTIFARNFHLSLSGFIRQTKNLVETVNIGVPFSAYNELKIFDIGDDRIPGTHDDLTFIVYNQKSETLGQDFFLLTNPEAESRISKYYGLDLTLVKKYGRRLTFFLSLTATSATGTTSPGNTARENDDGVVGSLYDNPNTLINARGRMRFDRAYVGRIGFNLLAAFGIRIAGLIKYYDGQPFARKIIVRGLNQGPFYIQAHPRGIARYEYNRTVDIRLEKTFSSSKGKIRFVLDVFNLLNRGLATQENEWTGPEFPLRFATEIQSPRVFRLGLVYEF